MTDIALVWDNVNGRADFAIVNGDLQMDAGLWTAVLISLFCDRQADPSDIIPDGSTDPRGWWGDTPPAGVDAAGIDLTGSKLWLLPKLQVDNTLQQAEAYVTQALQWMIADGVATAVSCVASYPQRGWLGLQITIQQGATSTVYDLQWSAS
jgi:phage gp46-like protein